MGIIRVFNKNGWSSYEEMIFMIKEGVQFRVIGKMSKAVEPAKSKTMGEGISVGYTSKSIMGLVLLGINTGMKVAITREVARQLSKNNILCDIRMQGNQFIPKYASIRSFPHYADVNDLTILLDFPDGEIEVCVGKSDSVFIVATAGYTEVEPRTYEQVKRNIQMMGEEALPVNLVIEKGVLKEAKEKW